MPPLKPESFSCGWQSYNNQMCLKIKIKMCFLISLKKYYIRSQIGMWSLSGIIFEFFLQLDVMFVCRHEAYTRHPRRSYYH